MGDKGKKDKRTEGDIMGVKGGDKEISKRKEIK